MRLGQCANPCFADIGILSVPNFVRCFGFAEYLALTLSASPHDRPRIRRDFTDATRARAVL
jgi:hypothetical protein